VGLENIDWEDIVEGSLTLRMQLADFMKNGVVYEAKVSTEEVD